MHIRTQQKQRPKPRQTLFLFDPLSRQSPEKPPCLPSSFALPEDDRESDQFAFFHPEAAAARANNGGGASSSSINTGPLLDLGSPGKGAAIGSLVDLDDVEEKEPASEKHDVGEAALISWDDTPRKPPARTTSTSSTARRVQETTPEQPAQVDDFLLEMDLPSSSSAARSCRGERGRPSSTKTILDHPEAPPTSPSLEQPAPQQHACPLTTTSSSSASFSQSVPRTFVEVPLRPPRKAASPSSPPQDDNSFVLPSSITANALAQSTFLPSLSASTHAPRNLFGSQDETFDLAAHDGPDASFAFSLPTFNTRPEDDDDDSDRSLVIPAPTGVMAPPRHSISPPSSRRKPSPTKPRGSILHTRSPLKQRQHLEFSPASPDGFGGSGGDGGGGDETFVINVDDFHDEDVSFSGLMAVGEEDEDDWELPQPPAASSSNRSSAIAPNPTLATSVFAPPTPTASLLDTSLPRISKSGPRGSDASTELDFVVEDTESKVDFPVFMGQATDREKRHYRQEDAPTSQSVRVSNRTPLATTMDKLWLQDQAPSSHQTSAVASPSRSLTALRHHQYVVGSGGSRSSSPARRSLSVPRLTAAGPNISSPSTSSLTPRRPAQSSGSSSRFARVESSRPTPPPFRTATTAPALSGGIRKTTSSRPAISSSSSTSSILGRPIRELTPNLRSAPTGLVPLTNTNRTSEPASATTTPPVWTNTSLASLMGSEQPLPPSPVKTTAVPKRLKATTSSAPTHLQSLRRPAALLPRPTAAPAAGIPRPTSRIPAASTVGSTSGQPPREKKTLAEVKAMLARLEARRG